MFNRGLASCAFLLLIGASCSQSAADQQLASNTAAGGSASAGTSGSGGAAAGSATAPPTGGTPISNAGAGGAPTSGAGAGGAANGGAGGEAQAGSAGQSDGGNGASAGNSGSAGAGGATNDPGCDAITSLYCDDYEAQTDGMPPTGAFEIDGDGTLVVDGSKPYRGTQSIHLTAPVGSGSTVMQFNDQFPVNDLYGRAMFFVDSLPTEGHHWDIVYAVSENGFNWEIGGMFGPFLLIVDPPDEGVSSDPFPTGEWFCLQWQFSYAGEGQDHTFHAKLNGTTLMNGEFTGMDAEGNTWGAGPWEVLRVGWTAYQAHDVDVEMWIDELAFGEQEIPCPTPP
jgi:hypothetical protein